MKINLLYNSNMVRAGYLNLDPFAPPDDPDRINGDIVNLDEYVEDAEATDIIALNVIDFMPSSDTNDIIVGWIKKLRHGGTITIGGVDIRDVAKATIYQQLSLTDTNLLLYGAQRAPWEYKKATLTLQHLINALQGQGMEIMKKHSENFTYHVTARRP
jgi:hypothetical protein